MADQMASHDSATSGLDSHPTRANCVALREIRQFETHGQWPLVAIETGGVFEDLLDDVNDSNRW
jgi:hypothetical protein